jgi:hypothetical protein
MSGYRIVKNDHTGSYRVERRGWFGWSFVMTESGEDYASFDSYEQACRFVCGKLRGKVDATRRWRIVNHCTQACTG